MNTTRTIEISGDLNDLPDWAANLDGCIADDDLCDASDEADETGLVLIDEHGQHVVAGSWMHQNVETVTCWVD